MIIDCDTCRAPGASCAHCVIGAFLDAGPPGHVARRHPAIRDPAIRDPDRRKPARRDPDLAQLDEEEQRALAVLAAGGLLADVPAWACDGTFGPLRLVPVGRSGAARRSA